MKYLNIIQGEVKRLEKIVEEILEFSRPRKKLEFDQINIQQAVNELITLYEDRIDTSKITLDVSVQPVMVTVDKSRMKQAMINLIQNAIEACKGYIEISSELRDGNVRIKFLNDGELITQAVEEKIFSPFFTTKTSGTGLGLPITKKIVEEEHNGKLTIERAVKGENEYTVFVIEIPVNLSEQEE